MPISEPWPLRMARIASSSIDLCGKRPPWRMGQPGIALRKPIRSVAAAGFWSGIVNGERQALKRVS